MLENKFSVGIKIYRNSWQLKQSRNYFHIVHAAMCLCAWDLMEFIKTSACSNLLLKTLESETLETRWLTLLHNLCCQFKTDL